LRGEAPIASHLLYTQPGVLNDGVPAERAHGIEAGLAWLRAADAIGVLTFWVPVYWLAQSILRRRGFFWVTFTAAASSFFRTADCVGIRNITDFLRG
jgi:hypothetical protein